MLRQREKRCIPAVAVQPRRCVDRNPQIVADVGTWDSFQEVFVETIVPLTRDVFLGEEWESQKETQNHALGH
jgi:hypothetical protein